MLYEAVLLSFNSDSSRDPSKGGFKTYEEAYQHALDHMCDQCRKDYVNKGDADKHCPCLAEWHIGEEDDE